MGDFENFVNGAVNDCVNATSGTAERLRETLRDLQGELREERRQRHPDACLIAGLRDDIADVKRSLEGLKADQRSRQMQSPGRRIPTYLDADNLGLNGPPDPREDRKRGDDSDED